MKRFIFLLVLPCVLAFQTNDHSTTRITFGEELELMNGNVKQLIEISGNYSRIDRDTINFDKRGNIIDIRSENSEGKNYHIKYSYRYERNGKPIEILTNPMGYSKGKFIYGKGGYITENIAYNSKGDLWGKGLYKYDTLGNVVEYNFNARKGKFTIRTKYKYNKGNITEESTSGDEAMAFDFNIVYQYKTFDSQNNWIQLVKVSHGPNGISDFIHKDTVTRKISYY